MNAKYLFLALLLFIISSAGIAQNKNQTERVPMKMLADTLFLSATEITLAPGQKTEVHTHPAHFYYALTPCNLKAYYTDGKIESYEVPAGGNGYSGPEGPHYTENTGNKTARFLIVELKEHPYTPNGKTTESK
jgi:quercetin dioxygenase-like cupin family protein